MAIVSLTEAKMHLKVDQSSEDDLIALHIAAAEEAIENYIGRTIPNKNLSTPNPPKSIKAAALLIISDLYENRDGATEIELKQNPAITRLLNPYRVGMGV